MRHLRPCNNPKTGGLRCPHPKERVKQLCCRWVSFIAAIPESKKDIKIYGVVDAPWPFTDSSSQARYEEEYTFFDDMLSCVSAQQPVNKDCVSSIGVSAGALFTAHLASARSNYLASFVSLSGGVGAPGGVNQVVRVWSPSPRKLPAFVLWGGPQDTCVLLNFETASKQLQDHLAKDGHFFLECVHNCKHSEPPLESAPNSSKYAPIWDFVLKHPFWLPAGSSPYQAPNGSAIPIPWCAIGKGSSTPRTGNCPSDPSCPI